MFSDGSRATPGVVYCVWLRQGVLGVCSLNLYDGAPLISSSAQGTVWPFPEQSIRRHGHFLLHRTCSQEIALGNLAVASFACAMSIRALDRDVRRGSERGAQDQRRGGDHPRHCQGSCCPCSFFLPSRLTFEELTGKFIVLRVGNYCVS